MDIQEYWNAVLRQDAKELRTFFQENARIRWHNTGEEFSMEGFIRANCEYPGSWDGEVERVEAMGELVITAVHVYGGGQSFHVVSFITVRDGKITALDEYWGDDGPAPQWRLDMKLG